MLPNESTATSSDSKKWINALVVLTAVLITFVMIRLCGQVTEWFDLESKIPYVNGVAQAIGIVCGIISFTVAIKNKKAMHFLSEVYDELTKVVWAKQDETTKLTVVIVIAVAITSVFLGLLDYIIGRGLALLY